MYGKFIGNANSDRFELEVIECKCGYHMGFDSTFIEQVGEITTFCPSCSEYLTYGTDEEFDQRETSLVSSALDLSTKEAQKWCLNNGREEVDRLWNDYSEESNGILPTEPSPDLYKNGSKVESRVKDEEILKIFPVGTWIIAEEWCEHQGCSQVFKGDSGLAQPFSYLSNYIKEDFRVATQSEIDCASKG